MQDLLQSQIQDSCRLALPEGLKDLMSDISREVLRAQPENLYQFISDYLSALLVAREHLFIASQVCDDVCKSSCCQELEDELRELSLSEEDVQTSLKIISEYFVNGAVKEPRLLQKLIQHTNIKQHKIQAVQEAVRRAFLRHQVNQTAPTESSSTDSELDETTLAAKHTIKLYKQVTKDPNINYDCVASKIQAAYRAYNVRRKIAQNVAEPRKRLDTAEKVHFQVQRDKTCQLDPLVRDFVKSRRCASKCSSVSLAGSFISLPLYKPYSIDMSSDIPELDEVCEKETENANFDYITNAQSGNPHEFNDYYETKSLDITKEKKTISFHALPQIVVVDYSYEDDEALEEDDFENDEDGYEESEERISENRVNNSDVEEDIEETDKIDELESEENSVEEELKETRIQQSEMHRLSKEWNDDDAQDTA